MLTAIGIGLAILIPKLQKAGFRITLPKFLIVAGVFAALVVAWVAFTRFFEYVANRRAKDAEKVPVFPKDGIVWHDWSAETETLVAERNRPVLLFVANPDPTVAPFLKAVLRALPKNERLRELLDGYFVAVLIKADSVPELFKSLGAGSRYNIAVLSPAGLTPMTTIDPAGGKPEEIAATITKVLEKLKEIY